MRALLLLASAAADVQFHLLDGFDRGCATAHEHDDLELDYGAAASNNLFQALQVKEGCAGCRDLCQRTPYDACKGYECVDRGSSVCHLWRTSPAKKGTYPLAGHECWERLDAAQIAAMAQSANANARPVYAAGAAPPPSPPTAGIAKRFELVGTGPCEDPLGWPTHTPVRDARNCLDCMQACHAANQRATGGNPIDDEGCLGFECAEPEGGVFRNIAVLGFAGEDQLSCAL